MIKDALMTGSRVYGTPSEASDWDVVVFCNREDAQKVFNKLDKITEWSDFGDQDGDSVKFGNINFVLCYTQERFNSWKTGTEELDKKKPVERKFAVDLFKLLRSKEKSLV